MRMIGANGGRFRLRIERVSKERADALNLTTPNERNKRRDEPATCHAARDRLPASRRRIVGVGATSRVGGGAGGAARPTLHRVLAACAARDGARVCHCNDGRTRLHNRDRWLTLPVSAGPAEGAAWRITGENVDAPTLLVDRLLRRCAHASYGVLVPTVGRRRAYVATLH